jgi:hypothetical protein
MEHLWHYRFFGPTLSKARIPPVAQPLSLELRQYLAKQILRSLKQVPYTGWRRTLDHTFESTPFHRLILILVSVEVVIGLAVSAEEFAYLSYCPRRTFSRGVTSLFHTIALIGYVILCLFVAEMLLKILTYRLQFFQHAGNIVDLTVIAVSFGLDTFARVSTSGAAETQQIPPILTVARLWRIFRLMHAAMEESELQRQHSLHRLHTENILLRRRLHKRLQK